jgi:hypothetical protein
LKAGIEPIKKLGVSLMKTLGLSLVALLVSLGTVGAQPINKSDGGKKDSPGTTGALGNVNANGVATDPGGVKTQQGDVSKSAPGTVGAAPGTTSTSNPKP